MTKEFVISLHKPFWGRAEEKAAVLAMRTGSGTGDLSFSQNLKVRLSNNH